ncbi:NAD(P)H-dependent oxidoreductase [Paracoccus sp. MBLB3053]|uniref:NAD(P)H-dependent oxidoreductase n=1 Tax=Paracoccus aurantius TaxID=3073814 RepID=A0ABU2HUY8_9RHOB|nr:NAD(P)H-dependent oxidoreductase [Paracoccus sp. MBLB3053]MDS9468871.1 NAD(P)H-dependent oxidoreductase [Paracoccus sp. MBLB3053]
MADLTAFAVNCSLRGSDSKDPSSSERLIRDLFKALSSHGVIGDSLRAADHHIAPGVRSEKQDDRDEWPEIRQRILNADIFVLATPIWLGQPSSIAKRVMERMDAFLSETDERNRMPPMGKVAVVLVVGNEDGAHHCHAACFQALNDVGFTIPAGAGGYWVGEAMGAKNYVDLPEIPDKVRQTLKMLASNASHLARLMAAQNYPGTQG